MGSEKQQPRRKVSMDNIDEKRSSIDIPVKPITRAAREREVRDAAERKDWERLVEMSAQPGGFQGARTVAWPFLLHVDTAKTEPGPDMKEELDPEDELPPPSAKPPPAPHRDERQVGLDTNRAFVHYPVESQQRKDKRKKQLTDLIMGVLNRRPQLSYFQGYHDILSTLQLTLHPSVETNAEAFRLLQECAVKISLHRARDAMGSGLEPLTGQLRILRRLIRVADPELALLIEEAAPLPYWAISPLMTLYTHDLPTLALAQRVMDWILARPPDAVIYLVAAFTLKRKEGVQKLIDEGDDGMMHSFLCSLPELEADEPEWDEEPVPASRRDSPSTRTPTDTASHVTSIASDATEDNSPKTPVSFAAEPPPYTEQDSSNKSPSDQPSHVQPHDTALNAEKQAIDPTPPSPESSLSSLPPQDPIMDDRHEVTVPLSQVLREADRLRQRYPIHDGRLRLDDTLGPKSMIRTWSSNPNDILGDDAAEEAVIATDQIVLPDLEDDVFDPYPPPTKPTDTRLALLPKLNMRLAVTVGIPVIAMGLAFASRSPTARAHVQDATAWAYTFIEVGGGMV